MKEFKESHIFSMASIQGRVGLLKSKVEIRLVFELLFHITMPGNKESCQVLGQMAWSGTRATAMPECIKISKLKGISLHQFRNPSRKVKDLLKTIWINNGCRIRSNKQTCMDLPKLETTMSLCYTKN